MSLSPLIKRDIHIWRLCLNEAHVYPNGLETRLLKLVSDKEHQRYQNIQHEQKRRHYLLTRALVRLCLSHYTGVPAWDLQFTKQADGKPEMAPAHKRVSFNLSHSDHYILCAVAHSGALGIDVEHTERGNRWPRIAEHYYSRSEQDYIQRYTNETDQRKAFYRLWTIKEAFAKATGKGLSKTLSKYYFELGEKGTQVFDQHSQTALDHWFFNTQAIHPHHYVSVAYQAEVSPEHYLQQSITLKHLQAMVDAQQP